MSDSFESSAADLPLTRTEVEDLLRTPFSFINPGTQTRRFPQLTASLRIVDLQTTTRVQNCLRELEKYEGLTDLSGLSRFTLGELLHRKNFGRKSLADLLSSTLPLILDKSDKNADPDSRSSLFARVTRVAERLRAQPYSRRVRCGDPRFVAETATLLSIANSSSDDPPLGPFASLHAIAHKLVGRTKNDFSAERAIDALGKIRRKIARARGIFLERELEEIVRACVTGRNATVTLRLWGWSGSGTKTLQSIGDEFRLTRERVRQIADKVDGKLRKKRPFVPVLVRTIAHVNRQLPAGAEDVETELLRSGLTESLFGLSGILTAAQLLDIPIQFTVEEDEGIRTVVRHDDMGLAKMIVLFARKVVSHAGLGKVADLCDQVQEKTGAAITSQMVKSVVESMSSSRWLDGESEWFFISGVSRNHLVTLINKVLSVAPDIRVNEVRSAIASDYRGPGFSPPRPVVLEFCRVVCGCEIDGERIISAHPQAVNAVLSEMEQVAYSVLREEGPLLHRTDFERKCVERGMNPSTFANYVGRLPILARYGPGVYGLRGAHVGPGDVERCIPPARRTLRDHGWTDDARPWLAVEISTSAWSTGIISIPTGIARFIGGKYLLKTTDGVEVGTLVVSGSAGWGLRPFFRRRGGEPGDVVMFTFDLQRQEASLRLGTKEDFFVDT